MKKLLFLMMLLPFTLSAKAKEPAKLRYTFDFILQKVLEKKRQTFNPQIPIPSVHYSSSTALKVFQDAIADQWGGYRPDAITNAYSFKHNMIFLMDEADYYSSKGRCMDDSLAHELTHYVQDRYLHWDINDESLEWDAVEIQTQFREEYCK